MTGDPGRSTLRRVLRSRRAGWALAAVLAVLGILLGARQLSRAADLAGQAVGDTTRAARDVGWLLLLLVAAGLALGLGLSSSRGRTVVRWLQSRLTTRPVRWLQSRLTTRPVRWGAAAVGVLVLLVLVVVVLPPRFTAHRHFDKAADELKAQNDVRTTLLQGLGALLVLTGATIGASVAYRGVQETRRQITQTAADNQEQFTLTRQGQITDRYTKAVEQLGHEKAPVRLGALYSLEHLAQDNPKYRPTVVDVICTYLRMPYAPPARSKPGAGHTDQKVRSSEDGIPPAQPNSGQDPAEEELQVRRTAQRILATHLRLPAGTSSVEAVEAQRREPSFDDKFWPGISLDLTGATLVEFRFAHVSVMDVQCAGATFRGEARFDDAKFHGYARFSRSTFEGEVWFDGATCQRYAGFNQTIFQGDASFNGAKFEVAAGFREANFKGDASFVKTKFKGEASFVETTFRDVPEWGGATFRADALFSGAKVLHLDKHSDRRWPPGWTVHPDSTDPSRGKLERG
jgi:Pentapeptide repeats (9 copies)